MHYKYTSRDVAKLLGISPATVRSWVARGKLQALTVAGSHFFDQATIDRLAADLPAISRGRVQMRIDALLAMPVSDRLVGELASLLWVASGGELDRDESYRQARQMLEPV